VHLRKIRSNAINAENASHELFSNENNNNVNKSLIKGQQARESRFLQQTIGKEELCIIVRTIDIQFIYINHQDVQLFEKKIHFSSVVCSFV
jgi:hypothetical protein